MAHKDFNYNNLTLEEALVEAISAGFYMTTSPNSKPGRIIQRMPEKIREALKKLKSDDISNIRLTYW